MDGQADLKLCLFGDQTHDINQNFKDLLHYRDNPVLDSFLTRAYDATRAEIFKLPDEFREDVPRFTCLEDLVYWNHRGIRCIPLDMAVTCMYQLGFFISQADASFYGVEGAGCARLGLCTGALAAAAASCSQSTLDLLPLAVDAVVVAFRTGLRVDDVIKRVSPSHGPNDEQSWSIIVPGRTATDAVDKFCEETMLPSTSKPYVSAFSPNGITVSGPPASLAQLVNSESFKGLRYKAIPIYGPYHAPHLYSDMDTVDIVGDIGSDKVTSVSTLQNPFLSGSGDRVNGDSFHVLLKAAVAQILLQPIRWKETLEVIQTWVQDKSPKSFNIVPIGTSADQVIYTALKQTRLCDLAPPTQNSPVKNASPGNSKKPKLAIIGMSGRFPGAKDNEAFWDLLYKGLDVHKPVPALHWDAKTHVDPTGTKKNTSATAFGCWLDDPAGFDARFFNISPREAPQIDPAQRLALMTAYEAIEKAGIVPDATPSTRRDRVGVFYGVTSNDWMETNSAQNIDTYFIPGGNRAFIPGRINYCFKFSGPSYAVDTACSSSLAGIHLACNSLWNRDIDTAIAGGTNVLTNPDFTAGLDRGHFLSRTGNCKTFDDDADGYCRGEGIGTVIIKRLDDALADNDPILGVILGAYTNHSAESESITRPHVGAQRAIFSKILNEGGVDPYTVSYVEMHGTGTQAGDAGEMSSVLDTFAPPVSLVKKGRESDEALYLGSAKANIGHGEAASGVSGLIKVLMMMQKNMIVPHCGIKTKINHRFPTDLQERNVNIALKPTAWKRSSDPSQPRRAFVNNFSAAGGNSALLIEDAPLSQESATAEIDPRTHHLIGVSAKIGASLQANLRSMLNYLKQNPHVNLGQLSYTTTARRQHHNHRVMLVGSSSEEISAQIEAAIQGNLGMTRPKSAPRVVFTFTGQGAQYPGMGKELFKNFSRFRTEMHRLDQIGQGLGFPSVLPVVQAEEQEDMGSFSPCAVQLASICMQIALSKLWASWGITPVAVIGHSLGEYAALNTAGVLSDADTIYLVGMRARLLQEKCTRDTHAMLVVKATVDEIAAQLKDRKYEIACINSPVETVLAGPADEVSALKQHLSDSGVKCTLLKVPYAFHSSQMDPILSEFKTLAGGVTFSKAKISIVCPLDGSVISAGDIGSIGPDYLASHCRQPVNMYGALLVAQSNSFIVESTIVLEIGPHPAISGMVKAVLGTHIVSLASVQRGRSIWQVLSLAFKALYNAGAHVHWQEYQRDFKASHKVLSLPAYGWDLKQYWLQYVNDWSLRKGDPPLMIVGNTPALESTTIHRIVEETGGSREHRIVVEADIARKDLSPLVQGHEVDGIPLCTPSVYADIALSLGTYLLQRYRPDQTENLVDVSDMTISKALILRAGATQQLIQAHADVDWSAKTATVKFMSFDNKQKLQEHSRCVLRFKDRSLQDKLQKDAADVKQKMQALRNGIALGTTARFNRPMVYRAIRPLARFHDDYRAIDEIVLNSKTLEASSHLSFGSVKRGGTYHTHPAIIDSLTQSCGFTMNCNDGTDLDTQVFMNHGWGSLQLFEPLDFEKEYKTYTRMVEGPDKLWVGDVVIFDGDKVAAFLGQVAVSIGAAESTKASQAMSIIAEESGIALSDLTDATSFGDVGIDSLLGLTISARFKEELDTDLDFDALFLEYPTVGDLKAFLGGGASAAMLETEPSASTSSSSGCSSPRIGADRTGATTPGTDELSDTPKFDFNKALQIISEESGVAVEELTDDTNFADSGVDSLLSLVIVSRLRDELELDIQHESLFLDCPTVADLKQLLVGSSVEEDNALPQLDQPGSSVGEEKENTNNIPVASKSIDIEKEALKARKVAVDNYVQRYTAGFSVPIPSPTASAPNENEKVVLVTGASGSLGGHLVYHIAQLPDVKRVICLNRQNKTEPYLRQQKAMRDKGIRFPEALMPKLLVLQVDSAKPMLGLSTSQYEELTASVTHLIHNAWPMSAKRALPGFEPQFQVMRNLIDFAATAVGRRPPGFKFSFQMVSSVGVVGRYGLGNGQTRTIVPEDRVGIDSVLPNGYGDAKWGCENMLDQTLHKHPEMFRTMAVRLGQIAGSKTSGYWNPMEHFGFLIKSSQTLNALPDVGGTVFWTPVNDIAGALADIVLSDRTPYPIYHIENPVGQSWKEMNAVLADALGIHNLIPFEDWVELVRNAPQKNNPATALLEFLDSNYLHPFSGGPGE
ncbi:Conidial yellow pigment biosynthesis polyketide synthase [Cytospora mali]|uniref:Conidial yellow pigment biosynthesis polyketide synthase n=1 Tax=Cytospora mali TaxID=578113 RepID=A0A194UNL3_CYTMA|nr:Conidial yellow pigment biosynthesis polyketide synthase [Valsa mali var. pyri (nom. inval.)]